jgi:nucleotide-binding universal stress UspA family protein
MYSNILVPLDIAVPEICESILSRAIFHLKHGNGQLTLLSIVSANADDDTLDEMRGKLMEFVETHPSDYESRIQLRVEKGLPSDQVLELATSIKADCILMGSHRGGTGQLGRSTLGSTAAKIATQATCDVCIVK